MQSIWLLTCNIQNVIIDKYLQHYSASRLQVNTNSGNNHQNIKCIVRLDQELDFIMAQQQELEEMLKPLEDAVSSSNSGSRQLQQADKERDFTLVELSL